MKQVIAAALVLLIAGAAQAQCQPIGWVKVGDKSISITERARTYEKQGVQMTIIVSGFCPFSPC